MNQPNQGPIQAQQQSTQSNMATQQASLTALLSQEPYKNFIRVEQIDNKNFPTPPFQPKMLESYRDGCRNLWDAILKNPKGSATHSQAVAKLAEATQKLRQARKDEMSKAQAQRDPAAASAKIPGANGQSTNEAASSLAQAAARQPPQQAQIPGQAQARKNLEHFPPDVQATLERITWCLPLNLSEGTDKAALYVKEANRRFGDELLKQRKAMQGVRDCEKAMQQALQSQSNGQDMSSFIATISTKRGIYTQSMEGAKTFMEKLLNVNRQHQIARQQAGQMGSQAARSMAQQTVNGMQNRPGSATTGVMPQQTRPNTAGQMPQAHLPQQPGSQAQTFARPAPIGHTAEPPTVTYTPQQAVALSRSQQSQQTPAQATPQSAQPFQADRQSSQGDMDARRPGQPISKGWAPQAPQPVPMAQSRPTLSGPSNGPVGAMGAPVITKTDAFLLQGPGDRVLDKKRLDELVRQVCGADAGDGDALRPEVAEVGEHDARNWPRPTDVRIVRVATRR